MTLAELNSLDETSLQQALTSCCGSRAWVEKMCMVFPVASEDQLFELAEKKWHECSEADWLEAFTHHPKIGDLDALENKFSRSGHWAAGEQGSVKQATAGVLEALLHYNAVYEEKFGYIFIVFASGKSASEMLDLLLARLPEVPENEIKTAAGEQHKITIHRLQKLLNS